MTEEKKSLNKCKVNYIYYGSNYHQLQYMYVHNYYLHMYNIYIQHETMYSVANGGICIC